MITDIVILEHQQIHMIHWINLRCHTQTLGAASWDCGINKISSLLCPCEAFPFIFKYLFLKEYAKKRQPHSRLSYLCCRVSFWLTRLVIQGTWFTEVATYRYTEAQQHRGINILQEDKYHSTTVRRVSAHSSVYSRCNLLLENNIIHFTASLPIIHVCNCSFIASASYLPLFLLFLPILFSASP